MVADQILKPLGLKKLDNMDSSLAGRRVERTCLDSHILEMVDVVDMVDVVVKEVCLKDMN